VTISRLLHSFFPLCNNPHLLEMGLLPSFYPDQKPITHPVLAGLKTLACRCFYSFVVVLRGSASSAMGGKGPPSIMDHLVTRGVHEAFHEKPKVWVLLQRSNSASTNSKTTNVNKEALCFSYPCSPWMSPSLNWVTD
jgi:hypothetical protein